MYKPGKYFRGSFSLYNYTDNMKVFERFLTKTDSKINPKIESTWSPEDYTDVLTHFRKEPPGPEAFLVVSVSSVQET